MATPEPDLAAPAAKRPKTEQTSLTSFFKQPSVKRSPKESGEGNSDTTTDDKKTPKDIDSKNEANAANAPSANAAETNDDSHDPIIPKAVPPSRDASWQIYRDACIYRKVASNVDPPRSKVAAFDLDGTLLNWRIAGWPSRFEHYELWNKDVIDKLRGLYDTEGYKLVIFSNQGAIRSAMHGKKATFVKSLLDWLAYTIDRPLHCIMSTNKKNGYHKPSPNMWSVAEQCCNAGQEFDIESSFFVGDSVGGDDDPQGGVDIQFAKNVGEMKGNSLKFYTPEEYLGPSDKENRARVQGLGEYTVPSEEVLRTRAALVSGYLSGPILLVLCGTQGSGKSYFCEQLLHDNTQNWVHLSQDTINDGKPGKREKVEDAARQVLRDNKSVVVDRMHLDETQRAYFVQVAKSEGVPAHAVVLNTPKDVVAKRVRERENHAGGVEGESGAKIAVASMDKLVMPSYTEGLALISASRTVQGAAKIVQFYRNVSSTTKAVVPSSFQIADGFALPSIALGTMGLGRKVAENVVSTAADIGFQAFDTAPTYKNEDKVGAGMNNGSCCIVKVPKRATSAEQVRQELSKSLSNLKRQQADLLLLHWPSDVIAGGTLKEVWQEMEKCKKEGLARAIGVCNFNVQAICMLLPHCTIPPMVNQVERHPLLPQWELVDFCAKYDILLQAHSPLGQGKSDLLQSSVVQQIATNTGLSAAQVVLQWNLHQGVAVVPKCSSEKHMREVLSTQTGCSLSPEQMKALNEIGETKRFVEPFFMYGSGPYCWGQKAQK